MNVLSLFDGISCGRIALERAGIKVDRYYSSEIDKYAASVSRYNYPDSIELGDITRWESWNIDWSSIDLILAGSPCQGFSGAGQRKGFGDKRSILFFAFLAILNHTQARNKDVLFLLENTKMKNLWRDRISELVTVEPVLINSALLSAQNRERYYWCNWQVDHPLDREIYLKDVVFDDAIFQYTRPRGNFAGNLTANKSRSVTSSAWEQNNFAVSLDGLRGKNGCFGEGKARVNTDKSPALRTPSGGGNIPSLVLSQKALEYMDRKTADGRNHWDFGHHSDVRNPKSAAIVANFFKGVPYNVLRDWNCIRKYHPIECERLQTIKDDYTSKGLVNCKVVDISNSQRYKAIGNGWTVDVIAHILKGINHER